MKKIYFIIITLFLLLLNFSCQTSMNFDLKNQKSSGDSNFYHYFSPEILNQKVYEYWFVSDGKKVNTNYIAYLYNKEENTLSEETYDSTRKLIKRRIFLLTSQGTDLVGYSLYSKGNKISDASVLFPSYYRWDIPKMFYLSSGLSYGINQNNSQISYELQTTINFEGYFAANWEGDPYNVVKIAETMILRYNGQTETYQYDNYFARNLGLIASYVTEASNPIGVWMLKKRFDYKQF